MSNVTAHAIHPMPIAKSGGHHSPQEKVFVTHPEPPSTGHNAHIFPVRLLSASLEISDTQILETFGSGLVFCAPRECGANGLYSSRRMGPRGIGGGKPIDFTVYRLVGIDRMIANNNIFPLYDYIIHLYLEIDNECFISY
jgi:hypothetical protein